MNNYGVTLLELCKGLVSIMEKHPELMDKVVAVRTECGYSGATIPAPIRVYTHKNLEGVSIYTNDDNPIDDYDTYTVYK